MLKITKTVSANTLLSVFCKAVQSHNAPILFIQRPPQSSILQHRYMTQLLPKMIHVPNIHRPFRCLLHPDVPEYISTPLNGFRRFILAIIHNQILSIKKKVKKMQNRIFNFRNVFLTSFKKVF